MEQTYEVISNNPLTYLAVSEEDLSKILREVRQSGTSLYGTLVLLENGTLKILHDDGQWYTLG